MSSAIPVTECVAKSFKTRPPSAKFVGDAHHEGRRTLCIGSARHTSCFIGVTRNMHSFVLTCHLSSLSRWRCAPTTAALIAA